MADTATKTPFDIPRLAVLHYEEQSGLRIAIHDVELIWAPFIPHNRFIHGHDICAYVKSAGLEPRCMNFEIDQLRPWLRENPEGGVKLCHAGVIELAVPMRHKGILSAVLFAGPRHAGRQLVPDIVDQYHSKYAKHWPKTLTKPTILTSQNANQHLEGLRQLAARLRVWREEYLANEGQNTRPGNHANDSDRRRHIIEQYIARNYTEPITIDSLAKELHLSSSRTAHLVQEVCGQSFGRMLANHRLLKASTMLWQTEYSVTRIAMDCGFGDISNFHRAFRRKHGKTPLEYRRIGGIRSFSKQELNKTNT